MGDRRLRNHKSSAKQHNFPSVETCNNPNVQVIGKKTNEAKLQSVLVSVKKFDDK
jgi:hypothetical protein